MNISNLSLAILAAALCPSHASTDGPESKRDFRSSMAMLGGAHLHYDPVIVDEFGHLDPAISGDQRSRRAEEITPVCQPSDVDLTEFPQWQQERGYWIGEYTFLNADGQPYASPTWNYPYASYRGFITGEVAGSAYRQRNVFLYPPADEEACETNGDAVVGTGVCGVNGNTKFFEADQSVTTCTDGGGSGTIEGLYGGFFNTKTTLIGDGTALLYQVLFPDGLMFQSQLTTLTEDPATGDTHRTRSAQGFGLDGASSYSSYYRERKVTETEFWEEFYNTVDEYGVQSEDLCKWDGSGFEVMPTGSAEVCEDHLKESFELQAPCADDTGFMYPGKSFVTCQKVADTPLRRDEACSDELIVDACPVTCGTCPT